MILAAGLLVLLGLGLFVAGILTGATALYWACVAVCVVAAVLLVVARRQMGATPAAAPEPDAAAGPGTSTAAATEQPSPAKEPPSTTEPATPMAPAAQPVAAGATAVSALSERPAPAELGDPPMEEVEVTDLLVVVDVKDEVLVIDERPRYHLDGCAHLGGHTPIPLPLDEAKTDGFTPCGVCEPDRNLAERVRARRPRS